MALELALRLLGGKMLGTEFAVRDLVTQDVIDPPEQAMGHGDDGFELALAASDAAELRPEGGVFLLDGRPRHFAQDAAQPLVAFGRWAASAPAPALVMAGSQTRP